MLQIKIQKLTATAKLPVKMTTHASGYDIFADIDEIIIPPKETAIVPTGFSMEIPTGYEAQIRPRSGLAAKHGIGILNAPGTIDADYRGEVKIILFNFGQEPYTINRDKRIAQMVIAKVEETEVVEVDKLKKTERNDGGFGHTG
ncbi:MAG TPA: dUTP diphosphatase [Candidatus Cloacimonetes bacterium]|nr:dUTP diphosphatase [Candidatus Cloacimonadota bacterium]